MIGGYEKNSPLYVLQCEGYLKKNKVQYYTVMQCLKSHSLTAVLIHIGVNVLVNRE
jgi:hypothetical protein